MIDRTDQMDAMRAYVPYLERIELEARNALRVITDIEHGEWSCEVAKPLLICQVENILWAQEEIRRLQSAQLQASEAQK